MDMKQRLKWLLPLFAIGLVTTLPFWNTKGDDVFITYRYVINFVEHGELAYNLGEPTYGTTSPLWFGVQCFLFSIFRDLYISSWVACFLSFIGCIIALWLLAEQALESNWLRFFAITILLIDPWFMRWAFAGQEISFKIGIAAFLIWSTGKILKRSEYSWKVDLLTGVIYTLGILTRPEIGLLVLLFLSAFIFLQQFKRALLIAGVVFILYGFWATFCYSYFGEFFPHTILVKTTSFGNTLSLAAKLLRFGTFSLPRYGAIVVLPVLGLIVSVFILVYQRFRLIANNIRNPLVTVLITLWIVGVTAGYLVSGTYLASMYTLIFSPFIPLVLFIVIESVSRVLSSAQIRNCVFISLTWAVFWSVGMITVGGLGSFSWFTSSRYDQGDDMEYVNYARWIDNNLPANARIATGELGIVGFFGKRYMIDLAGIATPQMLQNRDETLLLSHPTYFSLYGPLVKEYRSYTLRPVKSVSFLRVGGANAVNHSEDICTLYEVVGTIK